MKTRPSTSLGRKLIVVLINSGTHLYVATLSKVVIAVLFLSTASLAFGQGVVSFSNSNLPEPPDRRIYFTGTTSLAGTNFVAQLYYGETASSLQAHTAVPALFRPAGVDPAGTWIGGNRTTGGAGTTIFLQVRAWDVLAGATLDQAQAAGWWWGASPVFTYTQM